MKSKLYWFLTILVAAALLTGCASTAFAQTATPPTPQPVNRTLSVNGSGKVFLTPDIAYITIGVHTEGATATEAVSDNNEQTQAVISALQSAGIAEKDMQTNNFSIYPQQQYDDQGKPTGEVRYSVDNSVMVTVRNIDQARRHHPRGRPRLGAPVSPGRDAPGGRRWEGPRCTARPQPPGPQRASVDREPDPGLTPEVQGQQRALHSASRCGRGALDPHGGPAARPSSLEPSVAAGDLLARSGATTNPDRRSGVAARTPAPRAAALT
jgi:hypothetical protein